ncbi:hypothetical protein [Vibrio gangliei]|uniref:hypothetical protein n=1 Tax=Vibrio gangliei TaxID=2077090 RepID=UPI00130066F0|nr:hypothetical protein [Vibrio gangliei]
MMKRIKQLLIVTAAVLMVASCTPYASLDIGAPFKIGPVYVNPSIGIGGNL